MGVLISVILSSLIDTMSTTLGLSVIGHQKKSLLIFAYHMLTCSVLLNKTSSIISQRKNRGYLCCRRFCLLGKTYAAVLYFCFLLFNLCAYPLYLFVLIPCPISRLKRVIEVGSGYGLAGLVIAATSEAVEVVISDGNPQVIDYIQRSIDSNSGAFGGTKVRSMTLHWDQAEASNMSNNFDIIVASDCTFFKEFHKGLACSVKFLLRNAGTSEAIFFSPQRGNSLDKFLEEIEENGLHFCVTENYDTEVWMRHQRFMNGDNSWPSYEKDHCYPLLVRVTL
uniref:Calmodulin-lysine N-methyltransferase n=1 Tax=Manihot esculenta TaxID=3983 RepID=A0A2C9WCN1_MANES